MNNSTWAGKQAYFRSNSKPVYRGFVIGHKMSSGMSAHVSRKLPNCKNVRQAGNLKSMPSKTILLGLSIFRCRSERSVLGRPSWELAPYYCESDRTKDFTAWCRDASTEYHFNERTGKCGVVHFTSHFFVLDKSKLIHKQEWSDKKGWVTEQRVCTNVMDCRSHVG